MGEETLLKSGFLQVFLWERLKGLDVHPLPYLHARQLADSGKGSYMPDKLPFICKWFKRIQRKGQNFLKLLDNIESFIFHPYGALAEAYTYVPFYADVEGIAEVPTAMAQGCRFRRYSLLTIACLPLPTLGDSRSEFSMVYSPHMVRTQFELNQGMPIGPNHNNPFPLHREELVASQAYQNHCQASFREFQSSHCDRLLPSTARHTGLVSEEKAIPLSEKRNLPFISKSGDIVGNFPSRDRNWECRVLVVPEKAQHRCRVNRSGRRSIVQGRTKSPVNLEGLFRKWHQVAFREPRLCWQGTGNHPSSQ